ncbi:hypothetical protein [Actinokineospora pegani]|uniref:hypothetical protein n=1 Tax=Actinokineospora pegani TaxID=2654637 RepID=UPI0012EAA2B0|nr:hypothetical protein [Actinokineospora pegani]
MTRGRAGGGPEDFDAAFAEIVADLRREGVGLNPPSEAEVTRERAESAADAEDPPPPQPKPPASTWRAHETDIDWSDDNETEHYEPPEPPPLPKLHPISVAAIAAIVVGVALLVLTSWLIPVVWTPVGLACLATGVGTLLLRSRRSPRNDDDNGAQV